jgi:pantoate--beta-alanine ligase
VSEDLEKYPRTEESDLKVLLKNDCDVVFIPSVDEVYPINYVSPRIELGGIDLIMEGMGRPGHFDGVVQVVGRFFEQMNPDFSFFGEKDFQQLVVVEKMVKERNFKVKIVSCAIMREPSGLAMSSRNVRLSEAGLILAQEISTQLRKVKQQFTKKNTLEIEHQVKLFFNSHPDFKLSYFEIVDETFLLPFSNSGLKARAIIAVELEGVRLLDNLSLN